MTWFNYLRSYSINIVSAGLLTSMTGGLLYALWSLAERRLYENGGERLCRWSLKTIFLFFVIPAADIALRYLDQTFRLAKGDYLWPTPFLLNIALGLLTVWAAGFVCAAGHMLLRELKLHKLVKTAVKCDDYTNMRYAEICREMGVKENRVRLLRTREVHSPFLTGCIRPVILLPREELSERELSVSLIHELTHYKRRHILLQKAVLLIAVTQWYNPAIWKYLRSVSRYCEYACDNTSLDRAGGEKAYFSAILSMALRYQTSHSPIGVSAAGKEHEVVNRMGHSTGRRRIIKKPARVAALFATMVILDTAILCTGVYAYAQAYHRIERATEVTVELEPIVLPEYDIQISEKLDPGFVETVGETQAFSSGNGFSLQWTMPNGERSRTGAFLAEEGDVISLSGLVSPGDKNIKIGIVLPDGSNQSVTVHGYFAVPFPVSSSGTYHAFIQNASGTTVTVHMSIVVL